MISASAVPRHGVVWPRPLHQEVTLQICWAGDRVIIISPADVRLGGSGTDGWEDRVSSLVTAKTVVTVDSAREPGVAGIACW